MDEPESRRSVDFEGAVVPDRRRRRLDPLVIGSVLVATGVLIGVAWPDEPAPRVPTPAPSAASRPTPAQASPSGQVPGVDPQDIARAESVALGLPGDAAWGIGTYTLADGSIDRRWRSVEPGEGPIAAVVVVDSRSVVLVEVTSPPSLAPLDVRVWARGRRDGWDWIETGRPRAALPAGRVLLRPPVVNERQLPAWPAGRYRIDLLLGDSVARIDLTVDRSTRRLDSPVSEWSVPEARDAPRWTEDPPAGPFAVVDGFGRPLAVAPSGVLGIADAWLASDQDVARAWIPNATALGLVLPAGSRDPRVGLRRLVPEEVFTAPPPVSWALGRDGAAPATAVRFDARPRGRVEPGVYAIDAAWIGPGGPETATWTIELLPAWAASTPPLLDAVRLAADLPGRDGIVRDASFGREPANRRIEPLTAADPCESAYAAPTVALVLADPPDGIVDDARVVASAPTPLEQGIRLIRPVAGITIAYPDRSFAFPPGDYAVEVEGSRPRTLRFCALVGPAVPPG